MNFNLSLSKINGIQGNLQVKDTAYSTLHNFLSDTEEGSNNEKGTMVPGSEGRML